MIKSARVAVVIVNYRTPDLVKACLQSLRAEVSDVLDLRVFVGDAPSGDGSVGILNDFIAAEGMQDWVSCFALDRNGGFAYGNNEIYRRCVAPDPEIEYVHFLNPDTYIRDGAIRALVAFLQTRPQVGAVGSRLEDPAGAVQASGFRTPTLWREFCRGARLGRIWPESTVAIDGLSVSCRVDWVSGASVMIPRKLLDEVGLMDDRFFLYFEETDLMFRLRRAGYQVWHVHESRVVHLEGGATGDVTDAGRQARLSPVWLASRARYFRRRYGLVGPALANLMFLTGDTLYRLYRLARGRGVQSPLGIWRDYLTHGRGGA